MRLTPWRLEAGELEPREPQRRLQGVSEEAPRSLEEAPRSCRFAILPRVWWLTKGRQNLQIPGCQRLVLAIAATA